MKLIAKIIILVAVFFVGYYVGQKYELITTDSICLVNVNNLEAQTSQASLMFDFGNEQLQTFNNTEIESGDTVFDLLKKTTEQNNLEFSYKDYGGEMGIFVESINSIKNSISDNRFWQYWVNNVYAQVGAGSYELKDGDVIEWKYIKGQFNN